MVLKFLLFENLCQGRCVFVVLNVYFKQIFIKDGVYLWFKICILKIFIKDGVYLWF